MEETDKLIGTGKKHLVMGNVVEAVNVLQEACSLLAKQYGDTADECGEAFFWCGKALLDLARMENTVLGNALEGVPEEETEEEEKPKDSNIESTENFDEKTRDELRVQVYDAMAEEKKDAEKAGEKTETGEAPKTETGEAPKTETGEAQKTETGEAQKTETGEAQKTETGEAQKEETVDKKRAAKEGDEKQETNGNADGTSSPGGEDKTNGEKSSEAVKKSSEESTEKPEEAEDEEEEEEEEGGDDDAEMEGEADGQGEGDGTADKDSDDEEVGNLQLAWEMLEVAKVIYKRKEDKKDQLMAAQTHLKLGEVSSESGNYTQALEDFEECLKLQLKHLAPDSRLLAETHYQLGLTYGFNCQYTQAIEQFNSSISVIKSRLVKLQELLDKAEGPEALPEERKEMEELKALLPEIQEKVEDATEGLKSVNAEVVKSVLDGGSTSSAFPASSEQNGHTSNGTTIAAKPTTGVSSTNGHASNAPVSDISHLVRKKRKPEESPVKEGVSKKVKQEEPHANETQTNGEAAKQITKMEVEGH